MKSKEHKMLELLLGAQEAAAQPPPADGAAPISPALLASLKELREMADGIDSKKLGYKRGVGVFLLGAAAGLFFQDELKALGRGIVRRVGKSAPTLLGRLRRVSHEAMEEVEDAIAEGHDAAAD